MQNGIAIYGCEKDEAALFGQYAKRYGVELTMTNLPITTQNVDLSMGHRCISVSHKTNVTAPILQALAKRSVGYISTRSIGFNHIDVEAAERMGILVDNVAYSPDSVADYSIMLILMASRNTGCVLRRAAQQDYRLNGVRGKELRDMTIGVLGTGRIGQAVIKRLKGFGCRILAFDPHHAPNIDYVSLDTLLTHSDVVTLHLPLTNSTKHLLNRERIEKMKPDAIVVNTARGALIDTEALADALIKCKLGGAALDVIEGEEGIFYSDCSGKPSPNAQLARLQALSNVVITPHTAFYTQHALRDTVENTIINCLNYEGSTERCAR